MAYHPSVQSHHDEGLKRTKALMAGQAIPLMHLLSASSAWYRMVVWVCPPLPAGERKRKEKAQEEDKELEL